MTPAAHPFRHIGRGGRPFGRAVAIALVVGTPHAARGRDLVTSESGESGVSLDSALKATLLVQHGPDEPELFPERDAATSSFRARFALSARVPDWQGEAAYEQRVRVQSALSAFDGSILPDTPAPFRIRQLDWDIVRQGLFQHEHEIDRLWVAFRRGALAIEAGRLAIGIGRGVLFNAVDVLSPFLPTELDREWRRGVDATRVEWTPVPELSLDATAAFASELRDGAYLGRVRGVLGDGELGAVGGTRGRDAMFGVFGSGRIGDAEAHAEAALFRTNGDGVPEGLFGSERWIGKAVAGVSHTFDVGSGLNVLVEYHYSGYGLASVYQDRELLADPSWQARFARGDFQTLGQHGAGGTVRYDLLDELTASVTALMNLYDGSGVAVPQLLLNQSSSLVLLASMFAPWGRNSREGVLRSEYGSFPLAGFVQVRVYD
jgi:hypothetical protein